MPIGKTSVFFSLKKYILTCPLHKPTTAPMRVGAWRMCTRSPMDKEGQRIVYFHALIWATMLGALYSLFIPLCS